MELTKEYFDNQIKTLATKDEFKTLRSFLNENMVTRAELTEMRQEIADKQDINNLYNKLDDLIKETRTYHQEMQALRHQVQTMSEWIRHAAEKIGVEYKP